MLVMLIASRSAAPAAIHTWTGEGGANINWSEPSNWNGAAPASGETDLELIFPTLNGHYASNNDLSGLQVDSLIVTTQLSPGDYLFTGNSLTLSGLAEMSSPGSGNPNLVWQIPVTLGGDVTIQTSGRQIQLDGPFELGANTLTFNTVDGDILLSGTISGSGNVVKNGGAALTITSSNSYTGSTTANNGALYIASATALGDTATGSTFNGGFLGFNPGSAFTISEPFVFSGGDILAYGTPTIAGPVTLNATTDIQPFNANAVLTISGPIGGPGGLNKTGPGLLILSAPSNSYAGVTEVARGTLRLDAALSSTNPVTVNSEATLKGHGSSQGAIGVQGGGTVAPGSSPGQLSCSGLSMEAGANFAAEINGPTPISQYDTIAVSGPVSLGGATLNVALGYAPPDGQQFTLISQSRKEAVSGTFAGLPEGGILQVGNTIFGITYKGGAGNDVVLLAGPPHTPTITPTLPLPTPTVTAVATHTQPPTPTATGAAPPCTGDCDGNGMVAVNELIVGVNIALGNLPLDECPRFDANGDGQVTIPELIEAVGNALTGCAAGAA